MTKSEWEYLVKKIVKKASCDIGHQLDAKTAEEPECVEQRLAGLVVAAKDAWEEITSSHKRVPDLPAWSGQDVAKLVVENNDLTADVATLRELVEELKYRLRGVANDVDSNEGVWNRSRSTFASGLLAMIDATLKGAE